MLQSFARLIAVMLLGVCAIPAAIIEFRTTFGPESPVVSQGTGTGTFILDTVANTLTIDVDFQGLTGNTTVAHIHCCVNPPGNVSVATTTPSFVGFPVGVTEGTFNTVLDLGLASSFRAGFITENGGTVDSARAALIAGMRAGRSYFNIHTSFASGGEIRGYIAEVPEPGTFLLAGLALAGLLGIRRLKQGHKAS